MIDQLLSGTAQAPCCCWPMGKFAMRIRLARMPTLSNRRRYGRHKRAGDHRRTYLSLLLPELAGVAVKAFTMYSGSKLAQPAKGRSCQCSAPERRKFYAGPTAAQWKLTAKSTPPADPCGNDEKCWLYLMQSACKSLRSPISPAFKWQLTTWPRRIKGAIRSAASERENGR